MGFSTKTIQLWGYLHDYGNPHECFSCFVFWADWDPDLQNRQSGGVPPCPSTENVHQNMSKKKWFPFCHGTMDGKVFWKWFPYCHPLFAMIDVQSWNDEKWWENLLRDFIRKIQCGGFWGQVSRKKTTPMIHETQHSWVTSTIFAGENHHFWCSRTLCMMVNQYESMVHPPVFDG